MAARLGFEPLEGRSLLSVLVWDANGEAPGVGGSGQWSAFSECWKCWRSGSETGELTSWTDGSVAVFRGNSGTVTITDDITVASITFESSGYIIEANSLFGESVVLTFPSKDITIRATESATIHSEIVLARDQVWEVGPGKALAVTGVTAGVGSLTKAGAGALTLGGQNANSYVGITTVKNGTLRLGNDHALGNAANRVYLDGSTAVLDLNGHSPTVSAVLLTAGTIADSSIGSSGTLTSSRYDVLSGVVSAALAGSGGLTKMGTGIVTLSGDNTYGGTTAVAAGTLRLHGVTTAQAPVFTGGGADIQGGKIVLDYTGEGTPATKLKTLLAASYSGTGGKHFNVGKFQNSIADTTGLGLGWKDDTAASQITIMATCAGDADLSGTTNVTDLTLLLNSYNKSGAVWANGDFNYDGSANVADLTTLLNNYNKQLVNPSPETVTVESFAGGLIADGTNDFTAVIQAAVNSGAKVVRFTQTGVYCFRDVTVPSGVTVDLADAQCILTPWVGQIGGNFHAFFKASSTSDITIRGGVFDGNAGDQAVDVPHIDRYAGLYFVDCDRLTIENCRFIAEPYGNAAIRVRQGSNVTIRSNSVVNTGIYYNAYSGAQCNVAIDGNETNNCGISINDDMPEQHLFGWSISDNTIHASNEFNGAGIGARASDGVIDNNDVEGGYFGITASSGGLTFTQHNLRITNNTITATSGIFNPYGIEHYANQVVISGNTLVDCGIVTSQGSGGNVTITNNRLSTTLATTYQDPAISFGIGNYSGVTVTGNTATGYGTFVYADKVDNMVVTDNYAEMKLLPAESQFFAYVNSSGIAQTVTDLVIERNTILNAQRGFVYFYGASAAITVDRMIVTNNSLDSNSWGLEHINTSFLNSMCLLTSGVTTITELAYGATIATDASLASEFVISPTNNTGFAIASPTNGYAGQVITYTIRNMLDGALGAVMWNVVFKVATWTSPANAGSRSISFRYDGANWLEILSTPVDVGIPATANTTATAWSYVSSTSNGQLDIMQVDDKAQRQRRTPVDRRISVACRQFKELESQSVLKRREESSSKANVKPSYLFFKTGEMNANRTAKCSCITVCAGSLR